MANILEFLRTVLVDGDAQGAFRRDPPGYLKEAGFVDLTGEDVAEAMNVLRRSLPEPVAAGLHPFEDADGEGLPSIRPVGTETELDAAARVLGFAADRCPEPAPVPAFAPLPPPVTIAPYDADLEEPAPVPSWGGVEDLPPPPAAAPGLDEPEVPDVPDYPTAAAFAPEPATEPTSEATVEVTPADDESTEDGSGEPVAGDATFGAALDAAVIEARQRHEEAIRQYTDASGRTNRQLGEKLDELIHEAQARAGDITSAAEASVSQIHQEAAAARQQGEEEARVIVEQAQREADEVRAAAHAETDAARQEIEHRRASLRAAEEQLKEKLSGIDSLFRQVLSDDDSQPDGGAAPEGAGPP